MPRRPFGRTRQTGQEAERGATGSSEVQSALAQRLDGELEQARAQLERLNADALAVARQFEGEAAARAEAEAVVETLRRENAQLLIEIDQLRARLARDEGTQPA
jgi:hypothetical protein